MRCAPSRPGAWKTHRARHRKVYIGWVSDQPAHIVARMSPPLRYLFHVVLSASFPGSATIRFLRDAGNSVYATTIDHLQPASCWELDVQLTLFRGLSSGLHHQRHGEIAPDFRYLPQDGWEKGCRCTCPRLGRSHRRLRPDLGLQSGAKSRTCAGDLFKLLAKSMKVRTLGLRIVRELKPGIKVGIASAGACRCDTRIRSQLQKPGYHQSHPPDCRVQR